MCPVIKRFIAGPRDLLIVINVKRRISGIHDSHLELPFRLKARIQRIVSSAFITLEKRNEHSPKKIE